MMKNRLCFSRFVLSFIGISLFSMTAFAGKMECAETSRRPEVFVTAESVDMSVLSNLMFQFNQQSGSIMDFRIDGDTVAEKPVGLGLPKKVKSWNSYRAEKSEWISGGSFDCSYEFLTQKSGNTSFQGYLTASCVSGDGGVWKVEEDLKCEFH